MPAGGVKRKPAAANGERTPKATRRAQQDAGAADAANTDVHQAVLGVDSAKAAAGLAACLTDPKWREALEPQLEQAYFADIASFVAGERAAHTVHPAPDLVFAALNETPLDSLKVVILGQDPYHQPGQAHGLCFSVLPGVRPPPSLKNMYKELVTDIGGFAAPDHGYLLHWAKQGVLLLNSSLTVREGSDQANSHAKCGWQRFTDEVINVISRRESPVVFLLWGGFAQKKGKIIDSSRHRVLECAHPSPLSWRKWQGCRTFSRCNEQLRSLDVEPVDWHLPAVVTGDAPASPSPSSV